MNFLWTSYEHLMNILWTTYELLKNILQASYEQQSIYRHLIILWASNEHLMNNVYTFYETYYRHFTNILQASYEQHLRNIWIIMSVIWTFEHLTNILQTTYEHLIKILHFVVPKMIIRILVNIHPKVPISWTFFLRIFKRYKS